MAKQSIVGMMLPPTGGTFDPHEFIQKYEEAFMTAGDRNGFKTKKSFSPSTLGYGHGTCPRYWYIAFDGAEFKEDIDSKSLANMENGTYAHKRIQKNMSHMGILLAEEVEITNTLPPIRGYVDVIIDWKGENVPGEIKTANSNSFQFRKTTGKPSGSHFVQFLIYLKELKAKEGFLFYENKDTQEVCIIRVAVSDKNIATANMLYEWMNTTYGAWRGDQLPERPFTKRSKICKNCPVYDECYTRFEDGVIDLPALEVPTP